MLWNIDINFIGGTSVAFIMRLVSLEHCTLEAMTSSAYDTSHGRSQLNKELS